MSKRELQNRIKILFTEDQSDRSSSKLLKKQLRGRWKSIQRRDALRRKKIEEILKKGKVFRGVDYFRMGVMFQHGTTVESIKKAKALARKGVEMGHNKSKWLYAASIDRILMMQNKKQKYGTQLFRDRKSGEWLLHPVSENTTDEER